MIGAPPERLDGAPGTDKPDLALRAFRASIPAAGTLPAKIFFRFVAASANGAAERRPSSLSGVSRRK
jgi:hypothetical protein